MDPKQFVESRYYILCISSLQHHDAVCDYALSEFLGVLSRALYIDLCWAHIISPSASKRALHEMLDTVPSNKIFGYGGDYRYPELSYAHARSPQPLRSRAIRSVLGPPGLTACGQRYGVR